jgi:hypothetical protein
MGVRFSYGRSLAFPYRRHPDGESAFCLIAVWGIYNLSAGVSLPGGLDLAALQGSFIQRESVLRGSLCTSR